MGDFFGLILEQLTNRRWIRYLVAGLVIAGTLYNGDFSTSLPWIVLGVIGVWLIIHAVIDNHLASKRGKR